MRPEATLLSLVTAVLVSTGAGCGGNAEASCAFVVDYDGHRYIGNPAPVSPLQGKRLGTATQPGCPDGPGKPVPEQTELDVAAIDGVSPDVAIAIRGRDDAILIRDDVDFERLPAALDRLLRVPACSSGEQAVRISARWLGITGGDGHTELDLDPPYDLRIRVIETSFAEYARAELTLRVPPTLERPLSRGDMSSLWEGGKLNATVTCRDDGFLASALTAAPPG